MQNEWYNLFNHKHLKIRHWTNLVYIFFRAKQEEMKEKKTGLELESGGNLSEGKRKRNLKRGKRRQND